MFEHRLLLLAETFPPSLGGIQTYLSGLWGALPPACSWVVAAAQPGDRAWDGRQSYRVTRMPTRAWTIPRWRPVWQAAREIVRRERIEAVVCGKALFEGRVALRLRREFGIPYIVCTHAMEILTWFRGFRTHRDLLTVLREAGRITVVNEMVKQLLRQHGMPETALVKLYPGVREEFLSVVPELEQFRDRFALRGKRVLTAVGRLVPRKGHAVLIEAIVAVRHAVPGVHLLLVGEGPERPRLAALVERLGLVGTVTFAGALPDPDVRRAIALADVFALTPLDLPDDREGFGIVYLEAAAMGTASVASRSGGIPEAVSDHETGLLVPPGDAPATARALIRLLTDGDLRRYLATAARARVEKEFRWGGRALLFQGMVHALLTEQALGHGPGARDKQKGAP